MTQEEIDIYIESAQESMEGAVSHLQKELLKVRTGKASPAMFSGVIAQYYGVPTPISQMANIGTADARTITIQPWDKSGIAVIEKAIFEANLGVTPQNDGELIRIALPPLTEERRRDLVKKVKGLAEDSKIGVRNARRDLIDSIKQAVKDGYPEDLGKKMEEKAQSMTNEFYAKIDKIIELKEKDIMTV